jgi:predicted kinase
VEAIVFIGLQASGKSSFYRERFFSTHMRINLDMLNSRYREQRLLQLCIETQLPFVVDNTNPTRQDRQLYIVAAKEARFRVIGYYFQSRVEDCKRRNEQRPAECQIPLPGLLGTYAKLQLPALEEGFDELHYVKLFQGDRFSVEDWVHEIR